MRAQEYEKRLVVKDQEVRAAQAALAALRERLGEAQAALAENTVSRMPPAPEPQPGAHRPFTGFLHVYSLDTRYGGSAGLARFAGRPTAVGKVGACWGCGGLWVTDASRAGAQDIYINCLARRHT